MRRNIKRTAIIMLALMFILAGLLGLILPFVQGILFLAIGLVLLSISSRKARVWLHNHTTSYPKLHQFLLTVESKITKIIGAVE